MCFHQVEPITLQLAVLHIVYSEIDDFWQTSICRGFQIHHNLDNANSFYQVSNTRLKIRQ